MQRLSAVLLGIALSSTGGAFAAATAQTATVAASIRYEFVAPPAGLSDDFKPGDKTDLKFLAIQAIDGNKIDGALWQPQSKSAADTTMVVMIHGSGGSYRRAPESALGGRLAAKGYAALAIDTRQHDDKINTENFFDIRRDIDAAVYTARSLGYRKLVIQGHSLGNIQVQFYAATNWDRDIKAVMLLGAFGNLPWKTRNILVQNEESFQQLIASAKQALSEGKLDTPLNVKMHYFTGQEVPVTAQHFFTYRWDKTSIADGTQWIKRIPYPVLLVRDKADALIQPFEPYMLLDAAHSEGSLVKSIEFKLLPNSNAPSLKGHYFEGNEQALTDTLTNWLAAQGL
ncbi:alpha/beta hydrolase [Methylocella sp. CPCC 101449]|jgi:pimeloyl-ACP methyl ester carboxylesterase|uniref:alpha/beta hydrolase n=1 Tax=Methylocella sp. CPCC 101449 TaxID=2987531 RepID=UPI0028913032|nr:alpha/beta hydrolase [Methylocella sp. CPCC 101449]MDT2023139.1 alpha/beta hydrolase [Methylocella sp. CPCC 101449]HEV2570199.1 alpha/beta hydrolase [Beijerinckiaceae bacterium]